MSTAVKTAGSRLAYADLLRCVAALAVVVIHVTAGPLTSLSVQSVDWGVLNLYNALTRWCVPVFLMLSGMFMLDPKKSLTLPSLLVKNLLRILTALFFWGFFYAVTDFLLAGGVLSWGAALECFKSVLWTNTHFHLWFLYTITGLYLVTPILRAFVRGASRSDFHWLFLLVFIFGSLMPTVLHFRPSQTAMNWMQALYVGEAMQAVIVYLGCYVAGYYLKTYTLGRIAEVIIYLLGILGAVVTAGGTALLSRRVGWADLFLYGYTTPNVLFMAVAVFVLFRYLLGVSEERGRRRGVASLARVSFGVYLVHEFFLLILRQFGFDALSFLPAAAVPVLTAIVFLLSFGVAWVLNKIPFVGKYIT